MSSLTSENVVETIEYAKNHSISETQRWLVREKGEVRKTKIVVSSEVLELFKEIKNLVPGNPSNDDVMTKMIELYRFHHDPVSKAKRAEAKARRTQKPAPKSRNTPTRVPLTAAQKHSVHLRDQNQCTFRESDGERCRQTRWLHKHHVVTVHEGGTNEPDNVLTLCAEHHDLVHQLSFPIEVQATWFPLDNNDHHAH